MQEKQGETVLREKVEDRDFSPLQASRHEEDGNEEKQFLETRSRFGLQYRKAEQIGRASCRERV